MSNAKFHNLLLPGEQVLWMGRPSQGLLLRLSDWIFIPACVIPMLLAALMVRYVQVMAPGALLPQTLVWGAVIACLLPLLARFLFDAYIRAKTDYTITTQRVLIVRCGLFKKVTALQLVALPDVQIDWHRGDRGSLRFSDMPIQGFMHWVPSLIDVPQFIKIDDASKAFDLIQRQRASA